MDYLLYVINDLNELPSYATLREKLTGLATKSCQNYTKTLILPTPQQKRKVSLGKPTP